MIPIHNLEDYKAVVIGRLARDYDMQLSDELNEAITEMYESGIAYQTAVELLQPAN